MGLTFHRARDHFDTQHATHDARHIRKEALMTAQPHGGILVNRVLAGDEADHWIAEAAALPAVRIGRREQLDLALLATGAFSPLQGYMTAADYNGAVEHMRLQSGLPWSLPITLAVSAEQAAPLPAGAPVVLRDDDGRPRAILELQERFQYDRAREARLVHGTYDAAHPGVSAL